MRTAVKALLGVAAIWASTASVRADIETGLVAYYDFDGLLGIVGEVVPDLTGNGHDGVCQEDRTTPAAPNVVAGPDGLGDALHFDGDFYVEIPNHADFDLVDGIAVAAWVSVDALDTAWQAIFGRGDWSWRIQRLDQTPYAAFHLSGLTGGWGLTEERPISGRRNAGSISWAPTRMGRGQGSTSTERRRLRTRRLRV